MATKASTAVGSAAWISSEKENAQQLLEQEKEEITFPAQHEIEWLNEHMAEIFSRNQFNVTDVFKTPGKLRGKTPRTTRKRNVPEARIPLSDVFSSNARPSPAFTRPIKPSKQVTQFAIAQDEEPQPSVMIEPEHIPSKAHTDSGYHGSSQDEVEVDPPTHLSPRKSPAQKEPDQRPVEQKKMADDRRTTEGSFHSAKEDQTAKVAFTEQENKPSQEGDAGRNERFFTAEPTVAPGSPTSAVEVPQAQAQHAVAIDPELEDIGSPSDGSTPDRPLLRKSSLAFASLPAREPLKQSFGARISRTSQLEQSVMNRNSYMNRHTGGRQTLQAAGDQEMEDVKSDHETEATKLHKKSSTQRLHDKIDMLGKSQPSRPSKSIPSAAALAASHLKQSEAGSRGEMTTNRTPAVPGSVVDDDDDWIEPLKSPPSPQRPPLIKSHTMDVMEGVADDETEEEEEEEEGEEEFDMRAPELLAYEERLRSPPMRRSPGPSKIMPGFGHHKSASTVTLVSPGRAIMAPPPSPGKSISVSNPTYPTTTPQGSPKRFVDGHLSASKSKLQSIMKTAKGLFTSSAGVSAAAKMETLSPNALRMAQQNLPGLYPNLNGLLEDKPLPASPPMEGRKTRSSTEREKEERQKTKAAQKMGLQLEKAREQERQKAAQFKQAQEKAAASRTQASQPMRFNPRRQAEQPDKSEQEHGDMAPPPLPNQGSKLSRPTKPIRGPVEKPKPQPVAIRVGTLSQRMPATTSSLASNLSETLQSAEPRRPGLTKKTSTASLQSSTSNSGFKTSVSSQPAKPRALLAAERKKEQDEREAQRKADQKKELERKRAAQQEEQKKQELRQRQEAEKKERERVVAEQARRAAQKQTVEKKRQDDARRLDQQRADRAAAEAAERPPSRLGANPTMNRSLINHPVTTNPAKPAKRPLEDDAGSSRPQAPKYGAAAQQNDTKRRRTEDESFLDIPMPTQAPRADPQRPTMSGAPIRQSNLGKKPSIFNHGGYAPAPQPPHINQQQQMQGFPQPPPLRIAHPATMAQYANGAKIPFADAPNPPAHNSKTPASAYNSKQTLALVKSSPHYTPGEAIHLPEIPTDSEDEDSSDEGGGAFPVPDWATPGHLTDQLIRQEGMDGDAVFGPIAPLKMEEIFAKGNKERLKRMRQRTSSANWTVSGDGVTAEEVRADREMRERMRVEGGWRYGG